MVSPYDGDTQQICICLSDILIFTTGASCVPLMGFYPAPNIKFIATTYFTANTCANTINLPDEFMDAERFHYLAAFSIANSAGFGQI